MTDAIPHSHRHAHAHDGVDSTHAHDHARPRPASLLEVSAATRLGLVSLPIALLWGAVFWALH
jgi:hypothetical protein